MCTIWHIIAEIESKKAIHICCSDAFSGVTIFPGATTWEEEAHEWATGAQMSTGGAGPGGHATQPRLPLEAPILSIFVPDWPSWPKKFYIKTPWGVHSRRRWRNTKPRVKHCRSHLRSLLQPLQHHQHCHHDEEGVVHLWAMSLWK
jgi:hypothetical protein